MEPAAATPTTITQEEVPLESRTVLVDEGQVEAVVTILDEDDEDVHAIMAQTLPRHVIIQSDVNNRYLRFDSENPSVPNAIRYAGDYSFDLYTRFEVVPATTGTGLVHIRCLLNNKYWAHFGGRNKWITAMAVKPEENKSNKHCTLFQPVFLYSDRTHTVRLRHVSTGYFVSLFPGSGHDYGCLSLLHEGVNHDVCTFLDWNSVVVLPNLIRIKGDNGNHLKAFGGDGYMDYNHKADNSSLFEYEVSPSRDGGIRLKSTYYDKYWTDMDTSYWVLLKKASPTVHTTNTVFLPTILDGNRIIMKCLKNGKFCNRYSDDNKTSCLSTLEKYPDQWSSMEIEEPVISRKIDNVRYHLADARLYNEKTLALITDDSNNITNHPQTSQLDLKTTVSNTTNWSNSVTLKLGVKTTSTVGVPGIASGALEISAEVTGSWNWGETKTESLEVGSVRTITVPSMTRVKASLMATRVSYDIPFSYTQYDVLKDGSTKVLEINDGLFTGHNGYNYRYEVVELPLK